MEIPLGSFNAGTASMVGVTDELESQIEKVKVHNGTGDTLVIDFTVAGKTDRWEVGPMIDAEYTLVAPLSLSEVGGTPVVPIGMALRWQ